MQEPTSESQAPDQPPQKEAAVAAEAGRGDQGSSNDRLVTFGYITAILIPLIGFIVGIVLTTRGDRRGGIVMIMAVIVFAIFLMLISGA